VLANLFLHYAFDMWLARTFPAISFERYCDDAVIHCQSLTQARQVLAALGDRMAELGLRLHPDKTTIVYCKDSNRRGSHDHTGGVLIVGETGDAKSGDHTVGAAG